MPNQDAPAAPALKEIFNADRIHHIADEAATLLPSFDRARFLQGMLGDLDDLSLMARLRRVAESLHVAMPGSYRTHLDTLRALAPRLNSGFVTMALPEYVALHGMDDFDASMDALKYFTRFGSSEFAIRPFLVRDPDRTLAVMTGWAQDENDHVRRLASEGSRPRLPWSFRIRPLMADPSPLAPILEALKADPSLYVRKSVANSLNDITKDNPAWALDRIESWPLDNPKTAWIAKHALRSLIKKGDRRALAVVGAGDMAQVAVTDLAVTPSAIALGETITFSFALCSTCHHDQRLIVDYAIHYRKKSGATAAKMFKLKALTLSANETMSLRKSQSIENFTTRVHHAGRHDIEIFVNGQSHGRTAFDLTIRSSD